MIIERALEIDWKANGIVGRESRFVDGQRLGAEGAGFIGKSGDEFRVFAS